MPNTPRLSPESQFPVPAIDESIQVQPKPTGGMQAGSFLTIQIASAADAITPWGMQPKKRDIQLRQFWPTEPYLAGANANVCFRNSVFDWEIKGESERVCQAVTDMLMSAIAGDMVGWVPFVQKLSQDLYSQDNGAFIELIRDPGMDANSKFKGPMAPVIGVAHIDAGQCIRTGNAETPVLYTDLDGKQHKLQWYEVIPFSDFPSPIQRMNGVGVCAVSRVLRLAQIMRSIAIFKDENVSGRNVKNIEIIGGVSTSQIDDAVKRTIEQADNRAQMRFIEHVILASLDPEKPVSHVQVPLASLPEGFNFDTEMQWFIAGLALGFGTDYQEFAPLNGGNIGSGSQSNMLNRKTSGKGPRVWMDSISSSFKNYGVMPRGYTIEFNDKNQQDEMEKQEVRTAAAEEAAIVVNSKIFPPEVVAKSLVKRGIYSQEDLDNTPPEWWKLAMEAAKNEANPPQPVGSRGGNTLAEDAGRTDSSKPSQTSGARLRKEMEEKSFFVELRELIQKALRRDAPLPAPINVTVHNQPGKAPNVIVKAAEIKQPNVTVNVPRQPAPVVNIRQTAPATPNVTVNVPKQDAPNVTVNVPKQTPPNVTVNNPITVVGPKGPAEVEIEYKNGKAVGLKAKQ